MTRTAQTLAQLACALFFLSLFTPIPGLTYAAVALLLIGLVLLALSTGVFKRRTRKPAVPPPSPQQVMRNTRAALPDEYREWFDWTAEMAGFSKPPQRPKIVVDASRDRTEHYAFGTDELVGVTYREPPKKLPTVYRACPDRTCNISYGPGAGWTHTDQHTWVEMQT